MESNVNAYGTPFGKQIVRARNEYFFTADGEAYFDLFSSAGVANFGHNNPTIKARLMDYLQQDGPVHSLDFFTSAKADFIHLFETTVLPQRYRGYYHYYFAPPAGTLAIEAAIKYARNATGRREVACFTNAFHGLSYNALSLTGNATKRKSAYTDLASVLRLPYEHYLGTDVDAIALYEQLLNDESSGYGLPAAVIFETIQAEGGLHTCSGAWYEGLLALCARKGIVTIADEIQVGCGRAGGFFSFEALSQTYPDIICLAKSLSGFGLPMSLVLVKKELDTLNPGENSGTFRGNTLAVQSACFMLDMFASSTFRQQLTGNEQILRQAMAELAGRCPVRGRHMIHGIELENTATAKQVLEQLRNEHILVEQCGGQSRVIKIMPPLTCVPNNLQQALDTVVRTVCDHT
ncbi:diaminobutyrate--2-oxoglutarate transaminase [Pseudomonas sp. LF135]|uniref:diaminobutyrate--2-oxoglutarate transaminase n=1 Tax=unclassified Pseudomonas TaxID=196821 RepID=UPI001463D2F5|nr:MULTISPECIES: diaminobutyrate--2-oxoglutarate transaminase [unclassified Pseudomonas]MBK3507300.1 diaminobutyrate--2-oxoglutarate transaminase [Pseudomonas sp. MF6747]QJI13764.1 diaminobutyrate--2-oxoglutarate transaminase [Pseudomonas sp. ADAK22]